MVDIIMLKQIVHSVKSKQNCCKCESTPGMVTLKENKRENKRITLFCLIKRKLVTDIILPKQMDRKTVARDMGALHRWQENDF